MLQGLAVHEIYRNSLKLPKMNFSMVAFCRLRAQIIVVKFNYTNTPEEGVTNVGRFVSISSSVNIFIIMVNTLK